MYAYNVYIISVIIKTLDTKFATRILQKYRNRMAVNIGYKQFPEFDIRKDPETVYARFMKYAEQFKNNNLKAYSITDMAQQCIAVHRLDRRSHS